ncbi:MAG TPA: CPBP family intramembrane glutamic endopeptidase [Rhizomicrobium sp.]|jgi:membrane protease YdiL (CAAX protease family)|nr:CPBP family intramembrane glutamic endopeptidase [Rhizomicrobium sp.]
MTRYRPATFFALAFALSWLPWFGAAWLSYRPGGFAVNVLLQLLGLLGPFIAALLLLRGPQWRDFADRLTGLRRLNPPYLLATILVMPLAAVVAVWISIRLGHSAVQLDFIPGLAGMLPIMVIAPLIEELGWRGYGVDALRAKYGMRTTTLLFAGLWAVWHWPLFLINHSYQNDLLGMSPLYVANFFLSVIPAAIIANWLYWKHDRFIPAAILFHFMLDAVAESFAIEQFTKCIITAVFIVIAAAIMRLDRKAFAEGPRDFVSA